MPFIQINSTATNLWTTLLSVSVGFLLAQVAAWWKARSDRRKVVQQAAAACRAEVETNIDLTRSWDGYFQSDNQGMDENPSLMMAVALVPFQTLALESACSLAVFDADEPDLGIATREMLLKLRAANLLNGYRSERTFVTGKSGPLPVRKALNNVHRLQVGHLFQDLHALHAKLNEAAKKKVPALTEEGGWPGLRDETGSANVFGLKTGHANPAAPALNLSEATKSASDSG